MSIASPLLSAQVTINAPAADVWANLSDLSKMGHRSPQCIKMLSFGKPNNMVGSLTINLNRRGPLFWPTWSIITEFQKNHLLEWRVPLNTSRWRYTLNEETTASGEKVTRVVHERIVEHDTTKISQFLVKTMLGGTDTFEKELVEGMNTSLAELKNESENRS